MKRTAVILALAAALAGCGGGKSAIGNSTPPVDPSGNWQLQLGPLTVTSVMNQVGANVTGHNIRFIAAPVDFSCSVTNPTLTAVVSNGTEMDGQISDPSFGSISFTGQLSADGTTYAGTYSGVAPNSCVNAPASGAIQGEEIPSMTGSWTGTVQEVDSQGNPVGLPMTLAATITQDDATATFSGSYTLTNTTCFSSGTFSNAQISGQTAGFDITGPTGAVMNVGGPLGMDKTFGLDRGSLVADGGVASNAPCAAGTFYKWGMSH